MRPMKNDGGGNDADFAWAVIFFARDRGDNVVGKFDGRALFFFDRDVRKLAVDLTRVAVNECAVVFLFFTDNVVPFASFALAGLFGFRFSGLAERLGDFFECHTDGDVMLRDEGIDGDLAVVEFFEIGDEIFILRGEEFWVNPADYVAVEGFAFDAEGFVRNGEKLNLRIGGDDAEATPSFARAVNF